jgi:predicted metal-dependent HD superfamily phosphohydrolase
MQAQWDRLVADYPALPARRRRIGSELIRKYQQRGRHYHNLQHIEAMLRLCDEYEHQLLKPHDVRLAIWFHDAVYVSRRADNEERSSALALRSTARLGRPAVDAAQMILATKRHRLEETSIELQPDTAWFLDFDLAILGAAPAVYDAYAQAIRREYAWVPARAYTEGRAKVLRAFLERPRLYFTDELRARWEKQAQENLLRELGQLKA